MGVQVLGLGGGGPGLGVRCSRSHQGTVVVRSTDVREAVEVEWLLGGHLEHLEREAAAAAASTVRPRPLEGGVHCTPGGHMVPLGHTPHHCSPTPLMVVE